MIKTRILFISTLDDDANIECYANPINEVSFEITNIVKGKQDSKMISLDIPTAIKLSKTLRSAINQNKNI